MHTKKTLSFYLSCLGIFTILTVFLLFNLWQLRVSLRFKSFLCSAQNFVQIEKNIASNNELFSADSNILTNLSSKILNEPPIVQTGTKLPPLTTNTKQQQLLTTSNNNLLNIGQQKQKGNIFTMSGCSSENLSHIYSGELNAGGYNSRRNSLSESKKFAI